MKQFRTVFNFELKSMVMAKGYIITTAITIVLIIAGAIIPGLISKQSAADSGKAETIKLGVISQDSTIYQNLLALDGNGFKVTGYESLAKMNKDVKAGKIDAGLQVDDYLKPVYYLREVTFSSNYSQIDKYLSQLYTKTNLEAAGLSAEQINRILNNQVDSTVKTIGEGKNQIQAYMYTYGFIMLIYMGIILVGSRVSSSVATEKTNRTMEMMITTTKPISIIFGKIIGVGVSVLLQILIWLVTFMLVSQYKLAQASFITQYLNSIPLNVVIYAVIFFVLAFFLYAFMYGSLGSLVSRMEDLAFVIQPVTLVFVASFMLVMFQLTNVNGSFFKILSFVPFTSPMAMFARIAMSNVATIEIIISIGILVVTNIIIGVIGTKIYQIGVLLYGQPPKIKTIFKSLFSK